MPPEELETERRQSMHDLVIRVAILEDRMERVQTDLKTLGDKLERAITNIEQAVESIKDRPNAVNEFLDKNWKALVVIAAVFMGANVTVVDLLQRVLLGG